MKKLILIISIQLISYSIYAQITLTDELFLYAREGNLLQIGEVLEKAKRQKIDIINEVTPFTAELGPHFRSVLCASKDLETIKFLIGKGASVNNDKAHDPALHFFIKKYGESIRFLKENDATSPNYKYAVRDKENSKPIIIYLIENGADLNKVSSLQESPVTLCNKYKLNDILEILNKKEAKPYEIDFVRNFDITKLKYTKPHDNPIEIAKFSPSGKLLITQGESFKIWDIDREIVVFEDKPQSGNFSLDPNDIINRSYFFPEEDIIKIGGIDRNIYSDDVFRVKGFRDYEIRGIRNGKLITFSKLYDLSGKTPPIDIKQQNFLSDDFSKVVCIENAPRTNDNPKVKFLFNIYDVDKFKIISSWEEKTNVNIDNSWEEKTDVNIGIYRFSDDLRYFSYLYYTNTFQSDKKVHQASINLRIIDVNTGKLTFSHSELIENAFDLKVESLNISPDNKSLSIFCKWSILQPREFYSGFFSINLSTKMDRPKFFQCENFGRVKFINNELLFVEDNIEQTISQRNNRVYDVSNGKIVDYLPKEYKLLDVNKNRDKLLAIREGSNGVKLIDIKSKKVLKSIGESDNTTKYYWQIIPGESIANFISHSSNGRFLTFWDGNNLLKFFDLKSVRFTLNFDINSNFKKANIKPGMKAFYLSESNVLNSFDSLIVAGSGKTYFWSVDWNNASNNFKYTGLVNEDRSFVKYLGNFINPLKNYKYFYQTLSRGTIDVYESFFEHKNYESNKGTPADGKKPSFLYRFITDDDNGYCLIIPSGYYLSSPSIMKKISFAQNKKIFTYDQFDLQYNRPDIVLERIGLAPPELIKSYKKAYEKRLKRLNFNPANFEKERSFNVPEIKLPKLDNYYSETQKPDYQLDIQAQDKLFKLDRLNVWINGVPVYGVNGIDLKPENQQNHTRTLNLKLAQGKNVIEVSALNEKGVESLKERLEVEYKPSQIKKPNLHLITIGVSNYENSRFNLKYAQKDARDLAKAFAKRTDLFNQIIVDTILNEQATVANILKIKEKLKKTSVDDYVMVSFAGHGLLTTDADYYLATHNVKFNKPQENGLLYEQLENLLDGIPARQKVLMIDACNSGEVDKDNYRDYPTDTTQVMDSLGKRGTVRFRSFRTRGDSTQTTEPEDLNISFSDLGLKNSFELMKKIFTDLKRSTGATVISASGGEESALESADWNNGVFTYSVLSGLKEMKADLNKDGKIMLSELQDYVQKRVVELTGGRQTPTSRTENLENDFRVW
jgi:hypothetical protein